MTVCLGHLTSSELRASAADEHDEAFVRAECISIVRGVDIDTDDPVLLMLSSVR